VHCDLISLSPKLANSTPWKRERGSFAAMHEQRRLNFPVLRSFLERYDYQLKFVVDRTGDFHELAAVVRMLGAVDPARILVMARGTTRGQIDKKRRWIVPECLKRGYSYTPRLHIELFGNRRGT
jgi:7-carboxy-7-deazaguanine synthase